MKPVFKCDYCTFMGAEEEVKEHESKCMENYDMKSCYTCKHKYFMSTTQYGCKCGKEIPENQIYQFCPSYEQKEKSQYTDIFKDIFRW